MKRVLTAVILIPLVVLALFKAPLWLFTLLVLGVALLAAREYFDIAAATGVRPFRILSYLFLVAAFGVLIFVSVYRDTHLQAKDFGLLMGFGLFVLFLIPLSAPFTLMVAAMRRDPLSQMLPDAAVSFMAYPYIGTTLVCLPLLRIFPGSAMYILFLMLIVWAGDIAALYVGRALGKHKLAPRVSPGKTWEGSIASMVGAIGTGLLLFHFSNPIQNGLSRAHLVTSLSVLFPSLSDSNLPLAPFWAVLAFAICINIAAQLGDLVESALKRGAGLKDSGALLPGHGGVLDRIDALLFALPVGLIFYAVDLNRYFDFPRLTIPK